MPMRLSIHAPCPSTPEPNKPYRSFCLPLPLFFFYFLFFWGGGICRVCLWLLESCGRPILDQPSVPNWQPRAGRLHSSIHSSGPVSPAVCCLTVLRMRHSTDHERHQGTRAPALRPRARPAAVTIFSGPGKQTQVICRVAKGTQQLSIALGIASLTLSSS